MKYPRSVHSIGRVHRTPLSCTHTCYACVHSPSKDLFCKQTPSNCNCNFIFVCVCAATCAAFPLLAAYLRQTRFDRNVRAHSVSHTGDEMNIGRHSGTLHLCRANCDLPIETNPFLVLLSGHWPCGQGRGHGPRRC